MKSLSPPTPDADSDSDSHKTMETAKSAPTTGGEAEKKEEGVMNGLVSKVQGLTTA
jgi:hypothetical protein